MHSQNALKKFRAQGSVHVGECGLDPLVRCTGSDDQGRLAGRPVLRFAVAGSETVEAFELREVRDVDASRWLRKNTSTALRNPEEAALGPIQQACLHEVGHGPMDAIGDFCLAPAR